MPSMRCVTKNPPTTLSVAKTIARNPNNPPQKPLPASKAPTSVIPLIAFDPLINGVWSVGGTLVITSKPTKIAKTKIVKAAVRSKVETPDYGPSKGEN